MDRRAMLVALWAVFAAAAVGVGFAAAGLVGDPFTAGTTGAAAAPSGSTPTSDPATTEPTSPTTTRPASPTTTTASGGAASPSVGEAATRTLSTRAGLVSATCVDGLVRLSASPAVGWGIEDLDAGLESEGRVRFEREEDGRVEIRATCAGGTPRFELSDDDEQRSEE